MDAKDQFLSFFKNIYQEKTKLRFCETLHNQTQRFESETVRAFRGCTFIGLMW